MDLQQALTRLAEVIAEPRANLEITALLLLATTAVVILLVLGAWRLARGRSARRADAPTGGRGRTGLTVGAVVLFAAAAASTVWLLMQQGS